MGDQLLGSEFKLTALDICQDCLCRQARLKTLSETDSNQYVSLDEWQDFQRFVQVEWIDRMMQTDAETDAEMDSQLRSLLPEVVRLLKLLQMDRQFWQSARQAEKQTARQQQFVLHLTQLGQLFQVFQARLLLPAESRPS